MSLMDSVFPKVETRLVFTKDINGDLVPTLERKTFENKNKVDSTAKSGMFKLKHYKQKT